MNITKKKQTHREDKLVVTGDGEVIQGQRFKMDKLLGVKEATRIYCKTWGIQPISYDNYRCCITFKNSVSLYYTSIT